MAGRKLTFDREIALEQAMDLFWEKGYSSTGMAELLDRMGIKRQSLYNTFGSKHDLFLAAIAHYGRTVVSKIDHELTKPGSVISNIENFFYHKAESGNLESCRGCFVVNTMVELSPHDPKVADAIEQLSIQVEQSFEKALTLAIARKELPENYETKKIARYLYHIILGLNTRIKSTPNPEHIRETLDFALAVLHP